jgi:hypothetical protein
MSVNAGLAYGKFLAADEVVHHPSLPLYVIGRWHGRQVATGDASAGTVQASLRPENLPPGYPQDFFFTVYNLLVSGPVGAGVIHGLDAYSDDWEGTANQRMAAQIIAADTATENLPSPASIPFWLAWLIRYTQGGDIGALKVTWLTNVNTGAYLFHASGLVLMAHAIMPDFLKRLIGR